MGSDGSVSHVPGTKSRWRASGYCSRATVSRTTRPTIWRISCACSLLRPRSNLLHCLPTRNPVNDPKARGRSLRSVRFRFRFPSARLTLANTLTTHDRNNNHTTRPAEEGSTDELGVASQTHSHDGDADHGSKVGKLVGLSAYLPIGTEMPAFFGLVQRVYVLAFPPANADNHGQETTSLSCNLSALQAAPREPYSATLLLQDAHQVPAHPHTLHAAALTIGLHTDLLSLLPPPSHFSTFKNMCLLRIPASCVVQWYVRRCLLANPHFTNADRPTRNTNKSGKLSCCRARARCIASAS